MERTSTLALSRSARTIAAMAPQDESKQASPRPQSLGVRISGAWDWTLSAGLVLAFVLQTFFAERIGWLGTLVGFLIVLLVVQRLHSRRHQLVELGHRAAPPR